MGSAGSAERSVSRVGWVWIAVLKSGTERLVKGFVEAVHIVEVLERVSVLLSHEVQVNETEDDATEIGGASNVPGLQNNAGENAPSLQGVVPKRPAEFTPADMTVELLASTGRLDRLHNRFRKLSFVIPGN